MKFSIAGTASVTLMRSCGDQISQIRVRGSKVRGKMTAVTAGGRQLSVSSGFSAPTWKSR